MIHLNRIRTLLTLCLLLLVYFVPCFGQESIQCGTTYETPETATDTSTYFWHESYRRWDPKSGNPLANHVKKIKVAFHVIRRADGTVHYPFTEARLDTLFTGMKNVFGADTIRIELSRNDTIFYLNNSWLYDQFEYKAKEAGIVWSSIANKPDVVNIFIMPYSHPKGQSFTFGYMPYNDLFLFQEHCFPNNKAVVNKTAIHEMAHVFGVRHVFEFGENGIEQITRDTTDPDYNAMHAGDRCHDTPAHPDAELRPGDSCRYGENHELNGIPYKLQPANQYAYLKANKPDPTNYMAYVVRDYDHCRTHFSPQQIMIMRAFITQWANTANKSILGLKKLVIFNIDSSNTTNLGDSVFVLKSNKLVHKLTSGDSVLVVGPEVDTLRPPEIISSYKHLRWNSNDQMYLRQRFYNYDEQKLPSENVQKAQFVNYLSNIQISTSFDGVSHKGNFKFQNPWLIQYDNPGIGKFGNFAQKTIPQLIPKDSLPYRPKVFKDISDTLSPKPYYAIHAYKAFRFHSNDSMYSYDPTIITKQSGDFLLLDILSSVSTTDDLLDNGPPKPDYFRKRVWFKSNNQSITLNYKSYLASTDLSPFSTNSQRHLCFDQGYYYLAYYSNSGLYLTKRWYSPQTTPWQVEKKINFGFNGSYSMDASGGKIFLTAAGVSGWKLIEYDNNVDAFSDTSSYASGHFENPVLAISMNSFVDTLLVSVAERKGTNSGLSIGVKRKEKFGSYPTLRVESFTQAGSSAINPSLVCDRNGKFHLAWEEEGQIFYQSFTVDSATGVFAFTDAAKARVSSCSGFSNGRKPSITADHEMRANITWETDFYDVQTDTWTGNQSSPARNAIAYQRIEEKVPQQYPVFKFSNEYLFPVKNRMSHDPVIGGDKLWSMKKNIVWWSEENTSSNVRSMHSVVANTIGQTTNFTIKQFVGSGYTPIVSLNNGYQHNAVYVKDSVTLGGTAIRSFEWTSDTSALGFTAAGSDSLVELRGAALSGASFTAGVAFAVFEDSLTGRDQPFRIVPDTVAIYSLADIPSIVQTIPFMASRVKFSIRRYAEGISAQPDPSVFDTASIEWYAQIRSISNDSLLLSLQLGRLAKNEAMSGVDSLFTTFPRQMVYVRLIAETSPSIINCVHTIQMFFPDTAIVPQRWDQTLKDSPRGISKTIPSTITLDQNIPNPFTPTTEISYTLHGNESKEITLTVFDALGREVMMLAKGEHKPGRYSKVFDGSSLPSGTYIYTLRGDGLSITRRMTLVK